VKKARGSISDDVFVFSFNFSLFLSFVLSQEVSTVSRSLSTFYQTKRMDGTGGKSTI